MVYSNFISPSPVPMSIHMQNDHIHRLKTLPFMSEFHGLWTHHNYLACTKSVNLQTVQLEHYTEDKKKKNPCPQFSTPDYTFELINFNGNLKVCDTCPVTLLQGLQFIDLFHHNMRSCGVVSRDTSREQILRRWGKSSCIIHAML